MIVRPVSPDERKALRRRPLWTVADFALYMGVSHWQAKSALVRYDIALGGMLLRRTRGKNRGFSFYWAALAKHDPDAFLEDPIEQQRRLDVAEDTIDALGQAHRIIAAQTGQNTRDIARMKRSRSAAA